MGTTTDLAHLPLATERIEIRGKLYFLDLKENPRGRYLRITEYAGQRREQILLPMQAARKFLAALLGMAAFERQLPPAPDQFDSSR